MPDGGFWTLAIWDCVPGEDAWRSAYTVRSVLLELQAAVLDEELQAGFSQVSHLVHMMGFIICVRAQLFAA